MSAGEWRILQRLCEEMRAAHVADMPPDILRWAITQYRLRMLKLAQSNTSGLEVNQRVRAHRAGITASRLS